MATEVTVIVDPDNGAGTDYTSLAAAIAGEARNLVTADEQLTIKCRCTGGTADGPATINGFTTDATRYVKVWTDPSESYRHAGTYPSGNKYRIEIANTYGIKVSDEYVSIIGISISVSASSTAAHGIFTADYTLGTGILKIDKCIIRCTGNTSHYGCAGIYVQDPSQVAHISNTVVYGFYVASVNNSGIYSYGPNVNIYNCTVYGNNIGVRRVLGTVVSTNCAVFGNRDDFTGTITVDHCASDDLDGTNPVDISPGAIEADDWAACFTDYANGDFSLKSGSVCIGAGVDDPGSGLYSDDILGNARTSTWDIGAFEYVSAAPSGITGTLAATLADSTSSSAGAVAIAGASAQTLANSTTSSAGAVAITGASAPTLANATLSAAGAVVSGITGSFAQTLADSTLSGAGAVAVSGSLASTLADATVNASSSASAIGALSATLSDASLGASGAVAVSGSASATLADSTASSAGRVAVSGAMSATLADATLSAYFGDSTPAQLSITLASALPPPPYQEPLYANEEAMKAGEMTWPWVQYFQALSALQKAIEASLFSVVSGEFKNNTPAAGSVSWSRAWVAFLGRRHKIADGVTAHKYIYWSSAFPRAFQTSNYLPPLSATVHLVGVVVDGVFWYADSEAKARVYQAIESGGTIAPGMVEEASLADLAVTQAKLADLAVTLEKLAAGSVDITKCASSISPPEIFDVLPAPGRKGRIVFLTTDNKLYRDTGTGWTAAVETVDLSGLVTGSQIANGSIDITKCASSIRPPEIFDVLPAPGNKGRIVFLTSDNKLYRDTGTGWTVEVSTVDLVGTITSAQIADGSIGLTKFASGIKPPRVLSAFPVSPENGDMVYLTVAAGDNYPANVLYSWNGSTWVTSARATDIIGSLVAGQIAAGAIGVDQLAANAVTAAKLASNSVTADKIEANAVTSAKIAANAISSGHISADSIIAGKIAAGAVSTSELAAKAVTTSKLAVIPDNICPDPYFVGDFWSPEAPWTRYAYAAGNPADLLGVASCVNLTGPGTSRYAVWSASRPISGAGQTLRLRAKCNNTSNQACLITCFLYANNGTTPANITLIFSAGSGVTSQSKQLTIPNNISHVVLVAYNDGGGTMTGAMAVSELKLDVAASTDLIVDGAVTAVKLAADSVTADKILANSVTAGKIAAGAVGTTELAAKAATIEKLAVVPQTLIPDPYFKDESYWEDMYGSTPFVVQDSDGANVAHQMGVPRCFIHTGGGTTYAGRRSKRVPLGAVGKRIRVRFKVYNDANQTSWAGIAYLDQTGTEFATLHTTVAAGSGHTEQTLTGTVPAGTVEFEFWMRNNGAGMTGTMAFSEVRVDLAMEASMIVDGAILTQHLGAGQVTATKISVSNLSSLSANIGTVTAGTITGTTFRTASDANGNYMEISGTSLKGKDSGNNTIWEMFPAQGPLALTDYSNAAFEKAINTSNLVNLGAYGGYADATGLPNTPEGMAQAMSDAMDWYASTGFTGRWNVTSLLTTAPRYVLVAIKATVSSGYKAEIIAGPVSAYAEWTAPPYRWEIYFSQAASAVRVGIIGQIMDTRLVIVPVQKIGSSLFIHLSYSGSLTRVTGTVRIVGIFS